ILSKPRHEDAAIYTALQPRLGCRCVGTSPQKLKPNSVRKIEVFPVCGTCRRMEIRITLKRGRVVCVDPNKEWVQQLLLDVQK
uniref:Chemokine interleukin-8-like domain-containing protein n=1 Tax=Neogobius melanostomus TaxID=47308 RepID=A0A8C6U0V3_9GOBI